VNKWKEKANEVRKQLHEVEEWISDLTWVDLPDGVRKTLLRGKMHFEDTLKRYEKWAEE
jgi:hypothetical protein